MLTRIRESALISASPRLGKLLRNAGTLMTGNVFNGALSMVYLAILTRALGLEQFGLYGLYIAYIGLLTRLTTFQTQHGLISFGTPAYERQDRGLLRDLLCAGWLLDLGGGLAGFAIALLGAYLVPQWFGLGDQAVANVAIVGSMLIFNWRNGPTALLRIYDAFLPQAVFQNLTSALQLATVFILYWQGEQRIVIYLATTTINNIIGQIAFFGFAIWRAQKDGLFAAGPMSLRTLTDRCPGITRFVLATNGDGFVRVLRDIDIFIVNALLGVAAAGLYRIARLLTRAMGQVTGPLFQSIFPELARLQAQGDHAGMLTLMLNSALILGCLTLVAWIGFLLLGPLVLVLAFGAEYAAAYEVAAWCIGAMVIWGFTHVLSPALLTWQRAGTALLINLVTTASYTVGLYILVGIFGLPGAGIALAGFYLLWGIVMYIVVRRHFAGLR